jgi:hypothetical protein
MKDLSKPVFFDLDGICQLKIYGDQSLVDAVSKELGFYRVDPEERPLTLDLEVELARPSAFRPSQNPLHMPPYDFFDRHKLARWVIRFERLTQPPHRIRFYGNWFSRMIVAKQIIEPAIRWLSQPLGFIFIHSTFLCQNGRGALVAGEGGSGKTRLLLRWLARGNPFLSDDFTILSYGQARRFITPIRVGARLLSESGAGKNLSPGRRAGIYARTALRRLLLNYAKLQAKLDVRELFPDLKLAETAEFKSAVVIKGDGRKLEPIQPEEMVDALIKINRAEMYGFASYLPELSVRSGDSAFKGFFSYQQDRLKTFLQEIPCYRIGSLRGFAAKELDSVLDQISDIVS